MKKKIAIAVAVVLCLAFALSGCGMVNKKFTPETRTRKITQAVDMAAGLENPTGYHISKIGGSNSVSSLYVVEGTQKNGGKRETRVYNYSSGEMILSLVDTDKNKFYVRELDNVGYTIYVGVNQTDEELAKYREDNTYKLTHYGAIYSCSGKLIASREEKAAYQYIGEVAAGGLVTVTKFTGSDSNYRLFLRTYDDKLWEMNDKNDLDLIATDVPFYNTPVDYDYKAGGYFYELDERSIICYDSAFNRVNTVIAPIYAHATDIDDIEPYVLADGKFLYQFETRVPDNEKDFDYYTEDNGELQKIKLNTFIIDPLKGKVKKIKCAYKIMSVISRVSDERSFAAYDASIKNMAYAVKIENKCLDLYTNLALYEMSNDGKIGNSLNVVSNQALPLSTIDGKYFMTVDKNGVMTVFNNKLKEVKSYPASVLNNKLKVVGPYLIDESKQVIYDYALNEVYRSPKNADGDFEEGIIARGVGTYDYRIVITAYAGETADGVMSTTLYEFRDGQKKQLCTFSEEGDNMLVFEDSDTAILYEGYIKGGQYYCLTNSEGSEYRYYNFDGELIYNSKAVLDGDAVVGGSCIMVNAASNIYMLFK